MKGNRSASMVISTTLGGSNGGSGRAQPAAAVISRRAEAITIFGMGAG